MRPAARLASLAALLLATAPAAASAQAGSAPATPPAGGYRASVTSGHAHGTVVALVLRIPAGSAEDQEGFEGTAALLADVLRDQAARALGPGLGRLTASVDRSATVFTLLAVPEAWPRAGTVLDSVVFEAPLDDSLLDVHRQGQISRLAFEADAPGTEFQREAVTLLAGGDSTWARPVRGTSASLGAISGLTLERFRRSFYHRDATVRAASGPRDLLGVADPARAASDTATATSAGEMPWSTGLRTDDVRDVTSTWVRVAYPVDPSTPRTAAEMLARLVQDDLDPIPPDPDRYSVDVNLQAVPGGTALVVDATVFPDAANRWEEKITRTVARLAEPLRPDFFAWRRRRFRTERLLEEATPDAEARRLARDLLSTGRTRDLAVEIWGLDADTLARAAKTLGPPRILRFGPDLGQTRAQGRPVPKA